MPNAFEIDYLPVGEKSKSGDAIAIRIGDYSGGQWQNQEVFVIDGGDRTSGEALVKHITEVYKTETVDRVFLTHPDGDHASGLRPVLENLTVGKIWMHRPWNYWADVQSSIKDGRITKASFSERLQNAYQFAYDVELLARERNITIFPPHQGCTYSTNGEEIFRLLGPNKELYTSLIQTSSKTPEMHVSEAAGRSFSEKRTSRYETMEMSTESLFEEDATTSSENDMSLILLFTCAGKKVLFTGDAGTMGLYKAIYYAVEKGISLSNLNYLHVPHHGSRHNISQNILKFIHAPYAIVSCAVEGAPHHPSDSVTNALIRRGMQAYLTQGKGICLSSDGVPERLGWGTAQSLNFKNWVDIPD